MLLLLKQPFKCSHNKLVVVLRLLYNYCYSDYTDTSFTMAILYSTLYIEVAFVFDSIEVSTLLFLLSSYV